MAAPVVGLSKYLTALSVPFALAAQPPPQGRIQQITVDVSPNPAAVKDQVILSATVSPPTDLPLLYRFYVDGQAVCGEWQRPPRCTYVPTEAGTHYVYVEVGQAVRPQRGGRGLPQFSVSLLRTSVRQPLDVRAQALPPSKPRPVLLALRLVSPRVVAGDAAAFVVSVEGTGAVPRFVFDAGDGSAPETLAAAEFTHVYQKTGPISASVTLPPGIAGRRAAVTFEVAPPPPAPVTLVMKLNSSPVIVGAAASFAVSVEGTGALPRFVFDAGDGSAPETVDVAEFTHVYQKTGPITASVTLPPGIAGRGASVAFEVVPPPPAPVVLVLKLISAPVVAGTPASFAVSVDGAGDLSEYVLDTGDGSPPLTRRDATITHVYRNAGPISASVSLPAGVPGRGSSVTFEVTSAPPAPISLILQLASREVVTGQAAAFLVSVQGGGTLPDYVLDAGDGSAPETHRDQAVTHVYARSGRFRASVSLPLGVAGTGSSVLVDVPSTVPMWVYVGLGLLAIAGAYLAGRAHRPALPPVNVTLHPHPNLQSSFDPAKPRGVSLEVRYVPNLARMRFTPRVLIGREDS